MFGNVFIEAKSVEGQILFLQTRDEEGYLTEQEQIDLSRAVAEYHNNLRLQEVYWQQQSRVQLFRGIGT